MATATVGILRVLLSANTAEYSTAMKQASDTAKAWSRDMNQIGRQATQLGSALTKTVTLPILALGVGAAKMAIDFESSFAGVRKTVNATDAEFTELAQGFRNLAKTIPVNVNELNKIGEAAGALGIRKADILEFSSVMAQLGVTTNLTSDQAATSIAQIQNIFNAAGKDTKNFASALVALGNDGASTESQIVDFASRLAGAGHQIGLSQQSVLGFSAALANMGLNAEAGGSAFSSVMSKMSVAVDTGGAKLAAFAKAAGMTSDAFKALFKADPSEALLRFTEGLGKAGKSGENLTIILNDLGLKNIRTQDTMKRLAGGADQVRTAVNLASTAWRENTALTIEAQKRFETVESKLKLLWGRLQDVGITLGNALLPAINLTIGVLNKLLPLLDGMAKMFAAMPSWVQLGVIAFAGIVAAAGPVIYIFGQIVLSASAIAGAFGKKGLAARLLAGDIGILTTSLNLLSKATSIAAAAFIGWEIGRLIADLAGLDTAVARSVQSFENLAAARAKAMGVASDAGVLKAQVAEIQQKIASLNKQGFGDSAEVKEYGLRLQTLGSKLDVVSRAISHGAAETITYAAAIKFNSEWEEKRIAALTRSQTAQQGATKSTKDASTETASFTKQLADARQAITDLGKDSPAKLADLKVAIRSGHIEMKELVAQSGLSELAINLLKDSIKDTTKAIKEADGPLDRFVKNAKLLESQLQAAYKAGVPMPILLEEFKNQIEEVTHKAPIFGQAIGDATQKAAAALQEADLSKILKKANKELDADARQLLDGWKKLGSEAGEKLLEAQKKSNKAFLANGLELQKGLTQLETDSLGKRLELIRIEYAQKRQAVIDRGVLVTENLALIDMEETRAAEEATAVWRQHVADVAAAANTYPNIFKHALANIPSLIQQALTGGGGFKGAGESILSGLGSALGGHLFTDITRHLSNTFSKIGVGFTKFMGDVLPGIGAALGSLIGPLISKIFGTAGRDAVKAFAAEFKGGFDGPNGLHATLLEKLGPIGEDFWKKLTQATGRNDKAGAEALITQIKQALADSPASAAEAAGYKTKAALQATADKAREVYEYMRDSGMYAASAVADAFEKAKDAQIAALGETKVAMADLTDLMASMQDDERQALEKGYKSAIAEGFQGSQEAFLQQQLQFYSTLKEGDERLKTYFYGSTVDTWKLLAAGQGEVLDTIASKYKETFDKLGEEYKSLSDSVNKEAEEEFMGVVETQERARMAQIEKERADLQAKKDAEIHSAAESFSALFEAGKDVDSRLRDMFGKPIEIPIVFRYPNGEPSPYDGEAPEPTDTASTGGLATQSGIMYRRLGGPAFWQPKGSDTIPTMLTPGEGVVNTRGMADIGIDGLRDINSGRFLDSLKADMYRSLSGVQMPEVSGGQALRSTTILEVDKRALGRVVADVLPGELRRLGVRVRT